MYIDYIFRCVKKMNFLNCPNFNNTEECKSLKDFVEQHDKCGENIGGTFIVSNHFWFTFSHPYLSFLHLETNNKEMKTGNECLKIWEQKQEPCTCCYLPFLKVSALMLRRRSSSNQCTEDICWEKDLYTDRKLQADKILPLFNIIESNKTRAKWETVIEKSIEIGNKLSESTSCFLV